MNPSDSLGTDSNFSRINTPANFANPSDSLGTDSNFARTNTPANFAPAASDHHVVPSQVQYVSTVIFKLVFYADYL